VALRTHHRKELLRASALAGRRRKSNVKLEFSGTWVSMARTVLRYSVDGDRRALRRGKSAMAARRGRPRWGSAWAPAAPENIDHCDGVKFEDVRFGAGGATPALATTRRAGRRFGQRRPGPAG
jgi:hypothetical protein